MIKKDDIPTQQLACLMGFMASPYLVQSFIFQEIQPIGNNFAVEVMLKVG